MHLTMQVYNTILRGYSAEEYSAYKHGRNTFPTTIAALASAVVEIARATKLPSDLELFRGLGGLLDLSPSFWKADGNGCRGYAEHGFMSMTSSKATALEYSGAGQRVPKPMAGSAFARPCALSSLRIRRWAVRGHSSRAIPARCH